MNKIFLLIVAIASITACSDFLEPNSKSEYVPKDAASFNELLLGEAYQRNDMSGFYMFLGLLEDDVEATEYQEPEDGFDENIYLASYTWQPNMFFLMEKANSGNTNMYKKYYELILGANAVIDYLPGAIGTQDEINNVKAQAYALRGFYYFNLVNLFGKPYNSDSTTLGVPLKLNSGIENSDDYLERKTVAEVYAQILSDLHTAENTYMEMPEEMRWKRNSFRTNLPMVQLMLSRTYLYMENWKKASDYADSIIQNTNFRLEDLNNRQIEYDENDNLIVKEYLNYPTTNSSEAIWSYGHLEDMFKWTYEYARTDGMHSYFKVSDDLLDCFDDTDLRLYHYIVKTKQGDNSVLQMPFGKVNIGTDYYLPKNGVGMFGRAMRLSEAYLNYAEAQAHLGGDGVTKAAEALTKLRENRFDPEDDFEVFITDADELLEFIKEERRRELCFEGHRWFDLRRWGMPEIRHIWHTSSTESLVYVLKEKDPLYTVPIPDEALQENSSLKQNDLPEEMRSYEEYIKK